MHYAINIIQPFKVGVIASDLTDEAPEKLKTWLESPNCKDRVEI